MDQIHFLKVAGLKRVKTVSSRALIKKAIAKIKRKLAMRIKSYLRFNIVVSFKAIRYMFGIGVHI
ncbi:MAG: hypothetical protein LBF68_04530 [Christensenellaceae bacterium]|nr:hypothetical protein [Christensenellaceae bacterium]